MFQGRIGMPKRTQSKRASMIDMAQRVLNAMIGRHPNPIKSLPMGVKTISIVSLLCLCAFVSLFVSVYGLIDLTNNMNSSLYDLEAQYGRFLGEQGVQVIVSDKARSDRISFIGWSSIISLIAAVALVLAILFILIRGNSQLMTSYNQQLKNTAHLEGLFANQQRDYDSLQESYKRLSLALEMFSLGQSEIVGDIDEQ